MACEEVRDQLRDGRPLEPGLEAHARACDGCGALVADGARLGRVLAAYRGVELDLDGMLGAFQATVATERGLRARLRRLPTSGRTAVVLAMAAAIVLAVGAGAPRPDWGAYPADRMIGALGALGSLALGALVLTVRPLHEAAIGAPRRLLVASALLVPAVLAGLPAAHVAHPSATVAPELLVPSVLLCFTFGSVVALCVGVAVWLVERRSRIDRDAGVVAAVGSAIVGNLALQLHCPVTDPTHLLPGHAAIGFVLAGILSFAPRET